MVLNQGLRCRPVSVGHIYGSECYRGNLSVGELAPHLWPLPASLMETHKNVSHYSEKRFGHLASVVLEFARSIRQMCERKQE